LLFPSYEGDADTFRNPRTTTAPPPAGMTRDQTVAWINAQTDYTYLGAGRRSWLTPVILHENPAEMALGINILFGDGRVEFREMRWALETITAAKARMAAAP
jgi:prepilin-type processing-associated H-X9-DG protein